MRVVGDSRNWASTRPYSPAVVVGDAVYVSGHVPVDGAGATSGSNGADQVDQVLRNLGNTLESAGASPADVVATTVYLTDISEIDQVDAVYRRFFGDGPSPSRTTVQVSALGRPEFRVEISAIAYLRRGSEANG